MTKTEAFHTYCQAPSLLTRLEPQRTLRIPSNPEPSTLSPKTLELVSRRSVGRSPTELALQLRYLRWACHNTVEGALLIFALHLQSR